jgi:chromate transporter
LNGNPAIPTYAEALRFWARLGFISFGGPAGQIAILHREVVERRQWVDERTFTSALNFCMLLPGPEALQLAIYLGWKLHGVRGGLAAGLGFLLPSVVLLFVLAAVYVEYGSLTWLSGVLFGLKAAVVALVAQALLRIGRRALRGPLHVALALGAFVGLQFAGVPFPLILLVAAMAGALTAGAPAAVAPPVPDAGAAPPWWRTAAIGTALWLAPLALLLGTVGHGTLWTSLYLFFTKAAFVTFGGAYAVLGYVTAELVDRLAWITPEQSVAGLALAETTPGPLVIVLQFLGYMAGWNQPGALAPHAAALVAGALAAWATFLPSFVFIFLGAPHVDRLTRQPRIAGALAAVTAAVVGVIGTLALLLARVVLFPAGWSAGPDLWAVGLTVASWIALERTRWPLPLVLAGAAAAGVLVALLLR